ncbi:MAG: TauD/TfdA family dioxygenase [Rhodospirillaceae bacterium]|nr:TauD/TfdA family dioxygenase [Rhodospirillaceae bacterium]MBT5667887.1 TauD/TfdA family dioxygenase [Rhodospirillaceae bacterium]
MKYTTKTLNGNFGILLDGVTRCDLENREFQTHAYDLWTNHGGLLAVRGDDLADLRPEELVAWSSVFGDVENTKMAARESKMIPGFPILRIGNIKDGAGNRLAQFAKVPQLQSDDDVRYNPETRRPVWHTDSTFRRNPPIGSVFHCKLAPPEGAETLFADTRGAFAGLDEATKSTLEPLEAVCSLAHHDKKINRYSPDYPVLSPEQRAANPPNRVPVVLTHPVSGELALYGLNSSTCAVLAKGQALSDEQMDICDLEGIEDKSVLIIRDLLPYVTGPEFTVKWRWKVGDVVAWDNRCTIHAATGFDDQQYSREMWRLTLLNKARAVDHVLS